MNFQVKENVLICINTFIFLPLQSWNIILIFLYGERGPKGKSVQAHESHSMSLPGLNFFQNNSKNNTNTHLTPQRIST